MEICVKNKDVFVSCGKGWKEYCKEPIKDDDKRDLGTGRITAVVMRLWN